MTEQLVINDPTLTVPTDPSPEPPKRGRGRPPKSATVPPADPASKRPAADKAPASAGRPSNKAKRTAALTRYYNLLGSVLVFTSPTIGGAIIAQADEAAASVAEWAETNKRIAKWIDSVTDFGGGAGVLAAHLPILMAVGRVLMVGEPAPVAAGDGPDIDVAKIMGAMFAGLADV